MTNCLTETVSIPTQTMNGVRAVTPPGNSVDNKAAALIARGLDMEHAVRHAYGLLWAETSPVPERILAARRVLLDIMSRADQSAGIEMAVASHGQPGEAEILRNLDRAFEPGPLADSGDGNAT